MKKTLALVLSVLMVFSAVSMLSVVSFADDPTSFTLSPYDPGNLNGFQNWDGGNGLQTQLLICTTENVDTSYTWELSISDGETTKVISMKCSSDYDTWLRRFEVCLGEGENQFVPEVGVEYTINAKIYNADGDLVMIGEPAADPFICGADHAPIIPTPAYTIVDGVLTVSKNVAAGEGNTYPWTAEKDTITKVVVEKGVTAIDHHAFSDFNELVEVVIANTVTSIGNDAFSYCEKLTTLSIPASVTTIGQGTVWGSNAVATVNGGWETAEEFKAVWSVKQYNDSYENATYVYVPAEKPVYELEGGKYGTGMENWVNSDNNPAGKGEEPGVTEILYTIKSSTEVTADTLKAIYAAKADYTWTLTISTNADMSEAVTKVITPASHFTWNGETVRFEPCLVEGENQFVPVKDTVYYINLTIEGANAVYNVTGDATGYSMNVDPVVPETTEPDPEPPVDPEPQGPTYKVNGTVLTVLADVVGEGAGEARVFPWTEIADKITKVVIAKGVTKIDQRAFTKFPNLEEVIIADTVTEIGADAFSYNSKLTTLTIPTSVTTIGQGIVYSCSGITTIYGGWESAEAFKAVWDVKPYNTAFETAELKTYEDYTLEDGVLTLYKDIEAATEDAYPWAADKASIKKIIIWDTVSVVGARAFSNCSNLEEVVVGNGVLVLKQDAFSYCGKLTTITIPSTVGEIGQGIVYSSGAITTVYGGWETAEEFKAIWSVKNYNEAFEGEGVEYLLIGTVKEQPPVVDPPVVDPDDPEDPDEPKDDEITEPDPDTTTTEEEGGFPVWAIAVIVIAVVAVAAGVVVVLKKKKD